jgi:hypothetical protein
MIKANYTREGHKLGLKDALNGKTEKGVKYHWEMLKRGFQILNHKEAMDSFSKGYNTGFDDGLKKIEGLHGNKKQLESVGSEKNTKEKKMENNNQGYGKQIEIIESLEAFLINLDKHLDSMVEDYASKINELKEAGCYAEIREKLEFENFKDFQENANDIKEHLAEEDKVYAIDVKENLINAKNNL